MVEVVVDTAASVPTKAAKAPGWMPFFGTISSVMLRAKNQKLEPEDLLLLPPSDDVEAMVQKIRTNWANEVARAKADKAAYKPGDKKMPKPASLARAAWPLISGLWKYAFGFHVTSILLAFVGPLVLFMSISLIESTQQCGLRERALEAGIIYDISSTDVPVELLATPPSVTDACRTENRVYMGFFFALAMFISKCVEGVCQGWHAHLMTRSALRARAGLIGLIYGKCLWLSGMGGDDASLGKVQNLMANDAQFFLQFAPMFNNMFVAPIQIVIAFTALAFIIGPSFLAGLGVMLCCVPLQGLIIAKYFAAQMKRLKLTDQRVKLTNEMVQGMRVIKMYAWEATIQDKINEIRASELAEVRRQRFLSAFLGVFMTTQPLLVTVVTFSVYNLSGNIMTASTVLPAVSLFAVLRLPLAFIPMVLMQVANLKASLIRITRFLENDELPEHIRQRSINAGKQADASQHGRNAANAEVCAVSTVSAVSAAGVDAYASKMGASEVVSPTPSFDVACASAGDSGDLADIAIRGTFAWPKPEVPVGKGKGKGKGKGGGGGKDGKGDAGGRGGRGGRGRGGGSDEVTVEQIRRGMFRRKPLKAEPTVSNIAEMKEVEAVMSTDTPPSAPTSPEVKPTEGGGSFNRGRGRGRAARKSKEPPPKEPLRPTLHELDVTFPHGQLTMVAGAVGSGKSSLLCALLGELQPAAELPASPPAGKGELDTVEVKEAAAVPAAKPQGEVRLEGQAGYFAQTAFILNDTVRGNILLGAPMDDAFYQRVLAACALLPDLEILPGGDLTQIGEKGINLSGGQKARIALARACYARARTILLDDPLSAVDAHVGKHIFREVFGPGGLLAGCTRILVTHQTQFLPCADKIVILHEGKVLAQGTYKELRTADVDLSSIASLSEGAEADMNSILGGDDADADAEKTKAADKADQAGTNKGTVLINEEERASGSVSWAIHLAYLKEMGGIGFGIILLLACFFERAMMVLTDYWLAMWIDPSSSALGTQTPDRNRLDFWIPIYFGGVLVAGAAVFSRSLFMGLCMGLRAARAIYAKLAAAVLDAPMIFFETTPSGRILNRFTSDTEMMDFGLLMQLSQWINCISSVAGALVLICVVNPWFLCVLPFFAIIYIAVYYISCSATRDLQRLEAVSRSPIYTQFSETLNGLSTIRAFGATARFEAQSIALVTCNTKCFYNQDVASAWVSLRLDLCSAIIATMTVLLPVISLSFGTSMSTSPAAFGLCITYALELSAFLKFGTKTTLELQKGMASVERIFEYARDVKSEPSGGSPVPQASWPTAGRIVAHNMCVRYRPELDLALKDVCCVIEPCAKVGVVGRTGSGKTTFVSALWRLVEPTNGANGAAAGALTIDGTDISTLELKALRSRLAVIVQDPVLFNDSLRYNLDPFSEHSDAALQQVMKHAQLESAIAKLDNGLMSPVGEAGANFSVGQRQLICLARAMLRQSKVIVLDEATASIDNETDAILQRSIRENFADATVLTIAHRLHTIMDSTQIMLFDKGELKEHAPPDTLLEDPDSLFSALVDDTGSAAAHLRTLATEGAAARK